MAKLYSTITCWAIVQLKINVCEKLTIDYVEKVFILNWKKNARDFFLNNTSIVKHVSNLYSIFMSKIYRRY
jgi:hypothetical protein